MLFSNAADSFVGPPTPEMQAQLQKLRFCVLGLWVAVVGRFATGSTPFSDIMAAISGTVVLRDDPWLMSCHRCLVSTCLGQCVTHSDFGNVFPLMFFLMLCSWNCFFAIIRLFTEGPFMILSFCCQVAAVMISSQLYAMMSAGVFGDVESGNQTQWPLS
eukprot:CAMPEP_0194524562 /NCGR_PEP_ID=MMETSP0253-20130528/59751_1 /TAXON_ID=2966 /ORGANISM="Noctiluca scintillans" /LENGTH=158 /DNA_ID=CAMNT_0039369197 /DNA_START=9 /DNA_END=481 /DNA_ORIENTATION=-